MLLLATRLGLLAQTAALSPVAASPVSPASAAAIRVWLADTTIEVGAPAHVYVRLRETAHIVVLHADATGRIRVLFPLSPAAPNLVPGGEVFAIGSSDAGDTFRVEGRGTGTIVAVASRTPLRYDGLRVGDRWDYESALLLQPTAGNPFAALLDIADRLGGGRQYEYDVTSYGTPGSTASLRPPPRDSVCFACLAAPRAPQATWDYGAPPAAPELSGQLIASPSAQSNFVDCSNGYFVNSFCGVQDNRVTNMSQAQTFVDAYPVYVPYFVPIFLRRREPPPPPPQPQQRAIARTFGLRQPRTRVIPPPPRERPPIRVQQPYAPSHPMRPPSAPPPAPATPPGTDTRIRGVWAPPPPAHAGAQAAGVRPGPAIVWGMPAPPASMRPATVAAPGGPTPATTTIRSGAGASVPSRAQLRSIQRRRP